jgi:hypothetical protein
MAFNCFFGVELNPDAAFEAPMPPQTNLVLSQVCVAATATYRGRMAVTTEGPKKSRVCIATLHPAAGIFHAPCQLVFSTSPKLLLEVDRTAAADAKHHDKPFTLPKAVADTNGTSLIAGCAVHCTGYYERRDVNAEGAQDSEDDQEEEAPPARSKKAAGKGKKNNEPAAAGKTRGGRR